MVRDFIDGAVAHDLAHDSLGKIAQGGERFAEVEGVGHRVFHMVLHLPFDEHGVQVAGDHVFLLLLLFVLGVLVIICGTLRGGAKFQLLLALHLDDDGAVDAPGQLEVQAGRRGLQITAEALDHSHGVCRHLVDAGEKADEHKDADETDEDGPGIDAQLNRAGQGRRAKGSHAMRLAPSRACGKAASASFQRPRKSSTYCSTIIFNSGGRGMPISTAREPSTCCGQLSTMP
jgi:hypothetical protein